MSEADDQFREFALAQWVPLLRTAYLLTGDRGHAEDLVQSVLLEVHRRWGRIRTFEAPVAYARRVLVNLYSSSWRKRRVTEVLSPALDEARRVGEDPAEGHGLRDELWRACLQLPPRQQLVVVLRYYEDLTDDDIARLLGISVGTVRSQAHHGLRALRARIGDPDVTSRVVNDPITMKERTR